MGTALAVEDFTAIIREEKEYLQHQFCVGEIGIFGSFTRNEQQADSDVDVLVDFFRPVSLLTIIALENYLSSKFNRKVDVVPRADIRSELRNSILSSTIFV
jgi:predicted nucleotidyltransferase